MGIFLEIPWEKTREHLENPWENTHVFCFFLVNERNIASKWIVEAMFD